MGIYRGGNIKTDGLIFGYDADIKSSRFYKGEPTVNTYYGSQFSGEYVWQAYDGTNYGFNDGSDESLTGFYGIYPGYDEVNINYIIDDSDQVYKTSKVQKIFRKLDGYSQDEYLYITLLFYYSFGSDISYPLNFNMNEIKTLSFYYYGTYGERISININSTMNLIVLYSDDNIGTNYTTAVLIPVIKNGWQRISVTFINTSSSQVATIYNVVMKLHQENSPCVLSTSHYWKITAPQIELKNHSTPYTLYDRLYTDSLLDLSLNKNIINLSNVSFSSDGKGIPQFDGINDFISSTINFINRTDTPHSSCILIKLLSYTDIQTIWSYGGTSELEHTTGLAIYNQELCWLYNGYLSDQISSNIVIPLNEWVWIGFSRVGTTNKFYINGELKSVINNTVGGSDIISPNELTVGVSNGDFSRSGYLNGYVPILYIYDNILSDDEMNKNFNSVKSRFLI